MATDRLAAALAGVLFETRRRDEAHFERRPLALPTGADGDLLRAVATAAGVPVRASTGAWPADTVGELLQLELRRFPERAAGDVAAIVAPLRAAHEAGRAPRFDELPSLERRLAADGRTRYLRCGDGPAALLLVNAFGLTLDVWHELVRRVAARVRVLVLDPVDGDPCYGVADGAASFVRAVRGVLDTEGLAACHVAAWCGGAKPALALAGALPASVSSVTLFAPSFAGEATGDGAAAGGDSPFENSLATMCQVVDRLPAAAPGMARSMQALLARDAPSGDDGGAALFALHDRATAAWLHAPFDDADRMQAYSRQLLAFRAHRVADAPSGAMPLMLVTGERDTTTNNARARDLLSARSAVVDFELREAGHTFVHQNAALSAELLLAFLRDGLAVEAPHPRLVRHGIAVPADESLVMGEL